LKCANYIIKYHNIAVYINPFPPLIFNGISLTSIENLIEMLEIKYMEHVKHKIILFIRGDVGILGGLRVVK